MRCCRELEEAQEQRDDERLASEITGLDLELPRLHGNGRGEMKRDEFVQTVE